MKKVIDYNFTSEAPWFILIDWVSHPQVGHAGTLDPMATGLLIVCVGKATKVVDR